METKYVRVPFDIEMAKKITNGKVEGRVVTRDDGNARIICWDAEGDQPIIALIQYHDKEYPHSFCLNGLLQDGDCLNGDLMLEIPEYMTFKDGDIATLGWKYDDGEFCEWITILKSVEADEINLFTEDYVTFCLKCDEENYFPIYFDCTSDSAKWIRKPTKQEKQTLIDALKASKEPEAKYCLKMLSIEVKPEYEFKPKDWALFRFREWTLCQFSHISHQGEKIYYINTGGNGSTECLPYNDQTKHLLGTTDNWEEK